ncbi:MAG: TonB family protein [Thermodesulfobacteriota bacterium]
MSLAAHLAVILLMTVSLPYEKRLQRLIPVEIIELPPAPQGVAAPPEKIERYAQRSQRVERETIPSGKIAPVPPAVVKTPAVIVGRKGPHGKHPPSKKTGAGKKATHDEPGTGITVPAQEGKKNRTAPLAQGGKPLALYPSRERLAALSEDYEKTAPKAEKGKVLALNTTEHRYWYYMDGIKRKIELQWDYPDVAVRKGQQGKLLITFSLKRDGAIETVKLIKGSGYPILDNAALTAVKLAAPFHPFPEGFEIKNVTIQASFEYLLHTLRGEY